MKSKKILFWLIAIIITVVSAYFQRQTGPTKPFTGSVSVAEQQIDFRLIRTWHRPSDAPASIAVEDKDVDGFFRYKRYPSFDTWDTIPLKRDGDRLLARIPQQPAAGKVMYQIVLKKGDERVRVTEEPVIIRFRNNVPPWAMLPHIILMFAAMLFSNRAALAAIGGERTRGITVWTFVAFVLGGLVFGPIVQKYAFGDWWTGWPFGTDLTDNKTAFAFIFWIIALVKVWKNPYHRTWVIVAAVVLLIIYFIPHSLLGSEIDWTQEHLK